MRTADAADTPEAPIADSASPAPLQETKSPREPRFRVLSPQPQRESNRRNSSPTETPRSSERKKQPRSHSRSRFQKCWASTASEPHPHPEKHTVKDPPKSTILTQPRPFIHTPNPFTAPSPSPASSHPPRPPTTSSPNRAAARQERAPPPRFRRPERRCPGTGHGIPRTAVRRNRRTARPRNMRNRMLLPGSHAAFRGRIPLSSRGSRGSRGAPPPQLKT